MPRRDRARGEAVSYVDAQFAQLGYTRETTELWSFERLMNALNEGLIAVERERLRREGAALIEAQALDLARRHLALGIQNRTDAPRGDP